MKILIIPVSIDRQLPESPASERFRCDWLLPYLPADKFNGYQNPDDYDVIIYQKAYLSRIVREMAEKYSGKKLQIFDVTDPEWYFRPRIFKQMLKMVDAITVSATGLERDIKKMTKKPVYLIPDRHEFSYYRVKKIHRNIDNPVLVWFGYADNFQRIAHLIPAIHYYQMPLITICEHPIDNISSRTVNFIKWNLNSVNYDIIKGDIVLNPPDFHGYKSNNKTVSAWILGLPVAETIDDIKHFLSYEKRVTEAHKRFKEVQESYNISMSADEIKKIINSHLLSYDFNKNENRSSARSSSLRVSSSV